MREGQPLNLCGIAFPPTDCASGSSRFGSVGKLSFNGCHKKPSLPLLRRQQSLPVKKFLPGFLLSSFRILDQVLREAPIIPFCKEDPPTPLPAPVLVV
jgi:hypothetical protein